MSKTKIVIVFLATCIFALGVTALATGVGGPHYDSSGGGGILGPGGGSTDNEIPRFDGTSGGTLQGSGITCDDTSDCTWPEGGILYNVNRIWNNEHDLDSSMSPTIIHARNQWSQSVTNKDGANLALSPGIGTYQVVIDTATAGQCTADNVHVFVQTNSGTADNTVAIAHDGTKDGTAAALAASIDALDGVSATSDGVDRVYISADEGTYGLNLTESDTACTSLVETTLGVVTIYGGSIELYHQIASKTTPIYLSTVNDTLFLGTSAGSANVALSAGKISGYGVGTNAAITISNEAGAGMTMNNTGELVFGSRSQIGSTADGKVWIGNNANTSNVCLDVSTDANMYLYDGNCSSNATFTAAGMVTNDLTWTIPGVGFTAELYASTYNGAVFAVRPGVRNGRISIMDEAHKTENYQNSVGSTYPELRIYSSTAAATRTTEYGAYYHNGTNSVWETAYGGYQVNNPNLKGGHADILWKNESVTFAANPGDASKTSTTTMMPTGSTPIHVSGRVTTTGTNCTSVNIGTASDPDLFGAAIGITSGTTFTLADSTAHQAYPILSTDDHEIVVTAVGGNCFDLVVALTTGYWIGTASTSN